MMKKMRDKMRNRAGFTLLETVVSLTVIAVMSVPVMMLVTGSAKTGSYVNSSTDATSRIEAASRRITHNLRTASAVSAPANTTASSTLTTVTQQDPTNSNATYTVTYTLSGGNLVETDSRYGANTLATNVTAFTVTRQSVSSPVTFQITLTIGTSVPTTRTFKVYCRNL